MPVVWPAAVTYNLSLRRPSCIRGKGGKLQQQRRHDACGMTCGSDVSAVSVAVIIRET